MSVRERWFVDGWEFTEGDIRDVEYRSGQLGAPAMRGANSTVAHRTGTRWRPKVHDSGSFTLQVWLGNWQRQAQEQWDVLLRAVSQPHRLCTYRRITPSGESRYCEGEVTGVLSPTAIGQLGYRASIEVSVPAGYWRGDTLLTAATATSGPAGYREVDLAAWAASTAPLQNLELTLDGHLVAPQVIDVSPFGRGEWLRYALTVPNGGRLELDCGTWVGTATGTTYEPEALSYNGHRFLTVAATPPGVTPRLRLQASTIGPNGRLTVSGYRSYLC